MELEHLSDDGTVIQPVRHRNTQFRSLKTDILYHDVTTYSICKLLVDRIVLKGCFEACPLSRSLIIYMCAFTCTSLWTLYDSLDEQLLHALTAEVLETMLSVTEIINVLYVCWRFKYTKQLLSLLCCMFVHVLLMWAKQLKWKAFEIRAHKIINFKCSVTMHWGYVYLLVLISYTREYLDFREMTSEIENCKWNRELQTLFRFCMDWR